MNKFTPGPWFFEANTGRVVSAAGETLAFASAAHESSLQNGPVLAAAPELLEACRAALGAFENNNAIDWSELSRAIAKATGDAE